MEVSGKRRAESANTSQTCDTCVDRRSVARAAFGYCIECGDFLCQDCYGGHRDPQPSRNHRLLEGKQMPKERLPPVDRCELHPDEKIDYFCKSHSALACHKCVILKHRMCPDVCDISAVANDSQTDQRYKDLAQNIRTLESRIDQTRQTRTDNLSKIDSNKKQAKADIKQFCKLIREHLDKMEQEADDETDQIADDDIKRMEKVKDDCESISTELKLVSTIMDFGQSGVRKGQLFIAIEKATQTIKRLEEKSAVVRSDNSVKRYEFVPDSHLKDVPTDVTRVGRLVFCTADTNAPLQHGSGLAIGVLPRKSTVKQMPRWNMDNVGIKSIGGINVKTETDEETCNIRGSTMMEGDTTLAVTDWNNKAVKLVDLRQNKVITQLYLSGVPWNITRVHTDQLAVTMPSQKTIQFILVSMETSLSIGRQISVSVAPCGITHSDDRLFVSCQNPPQIQILSMSGNILQSISSQTNRTLELKYPNHLTLSVDQSLMYVSDSGTGHVYCLGMDGDVKAVHKDKQLVRPVGMAVGEDGSVIVCGRSSNNLYMISGDGSRGRVLGSVQEPKCVAYSRVLSTLYVGHWNSNELRVFKMQ